MLKMQVMNLEEEIRREEEILCEIIENEYEMWKYGDRDTYDKVLGQERVDNQREHIKLLKNKLYELYELLDNC